MNKKIPFLIFTFFIVGTIAYLTQDWLLKNAQHIYHLAGAIAFLTAAGFFMWKYWSGYMVANLTIGLEVERKHLSTDQDILHLVMFLEKGDRTTLHLQKVRVIYTSLEGAELLDTKVKDPRPRGRDNMIKMTPGEKTQFSHLIKVSGDEIVHIQVTVKACVYPISMYTGYWQASTYSAPIRELAENA